MVYVLSMPRRPTRIHDPELDDPSYNLPLNGPPIFTPTFLRANPPEVRTRWVFTGAEINMILDGVTPPANDLVAVFRDEERRTESEEGYVRIFVRRDGTITPFYYAPRSGGVELGRSVSPFHTIQARNAPLFNPETGMLAEYWRVVVLLGSTIVRAFPNFGDRRRESSYL